MQSDNYKDQQQINGNDAKEISACSLSPNFEVPYVHSCYPRGNLILSSSISLTYVNIYDCAKFYSDRCAIDIGICATTLCLPKAQLGIFSQHPKRTTPACWLRNYVEHDAVSTIDNCNVWKSDSCSTHPFPSFAWNIPSEGSLFTQTRTTERTIFYQRLRCDYVKSDVCWSDCGPISVVAKARRTNLWLPPYGIGSESGGNERYQLTGFSCWW